MSDTRSRSPLSKTTHVPESEHASSPMASELNAFVIAWSATEPDRVGELAIVPSSSPPLILGRGDPDPGEQESRLRFVRQRPGAHDPTPALTSPGISRRQLAIHPSPGGARVERLGRCALEVNGVRCDEAQIAPGDVIVLRRELVLYCARRPAIIPPARLFPSDRAGDFGEPDAFGIIGESSGVWRMREAIAFAAKSDTHALILGETGTGKELAARAIHALSTRARRPFVARNAATLPPSLVDAELFGNAKNYPNPGMPDRTGLVGEADGGTLFLDEIGELPSELQAHLLRVLDSDGEYQRLGESTVRRSHLRMVAATNREASSLKHDFAARFIATVELPNLAARREDIPLLARSLLLRAAQKSPEIAGRFMVVSTTGRRYPRMHGNLVAYLLRHEYKANVRELDALLWKALAESYGDTIELPPALREVGAAADPSSSRPAEEIRALAERLAERFVLPPRAEPTADEIRVALATSEGSVPRAARALGLSSRYALYRLMRKHGIRGGNEGDGETS